MQVKFLLNLFTGVLTVLSTTACTKLDSEPTNQRKEFSAEVVYGEDNRLDFFEVEDEDWKRLAQSTVALFDYSDLIESSDGQFYHLQTSPYGKSNNLCIEEPFYEQPSGSFCSGFLVASDIIITAGHCLRNKYNCENVRFVFGYSYNDENSEPLVVPKKSVALCKEIIHTQANALTGADFAIVRLKEKVITPLPLPLRTQGTITEADKLTVIGYPSGLPGKLADGGSVRESEESGFFVSTLDTYGGNSGSAVFNSDTRLIEGILVRGETDFVYDPVRKCRQTNVCDEDSCRGEDVVRISEIFRFIDPKELEP